MEEIHRFSNEPMKQDDHLFWDINLLLNEIKNGLKKYVEKYGASVSGIGIDTWGVDFGLVDDQQLLLENPYSYRDTHTAKVMADVHQKVAEKRLFTKTVINSAAFNTICNLSLF